MEIDNTKFEYVCNIEPIKGADGKIIPLFPQGRYKNLRNLPLNNYGAGPFCKFRIPNNYKVSGVYAITVDGLIKYIGECVNLSSRYNSGYGNISPRNCFKGGQETNCRLNALILFEARENKSIQLWFHQTAKHKELERQFLQASNYSWNNQR